MMVVGPISRAARRARSKKIWLVDWLMRRILGADRVSVSPFQLGVHRRVGAPARMIDLSTTVLRCGIWRVSTYAGRADDEACRYACLSLGPTVSGQ